MVLAAFVMSIDLLLLRRWIKPLFIFSVFLLFIVFIPAVGKTVGGARRWIKIGSFAFQPSELVRWTTVLFLADALAQKVKENMHQLRDFFWAFGHQWWRVGADTNPTGFGWGAFGSGGQYGVVFCGRDEHAAYPGDVVGVFASALFRNFSCPLP